MRTSIFGFVAAALLAVSVSAGAPVPHSLIGIEFSNNSSSLFDINKATAATSNLRPTGISSPIDLAVAPNGSLFTAPASTGPGGQLYTLNPVTGSPTAIGATGLSSLIEGGMAFSPGGILFGAWIAGTKSLVTFNTTTGAATDVGPITGSDDVSGLAFNSTGTLYALDLHTNTGTVPQLYTLNTATGAILTTTTLSATLGLPLAGMAFDPDSGALYVAASGTASLYTVNTTSGVLSSIGSLGAPGTDVSGIAFISTVPEPSSALACVALGGVFLRRNRSRRTPV